MLSLFLKGTESELEPIKTEGDHSTLETDSEKEVIPVLPTDPVSNDDGAIAEMENVEVNVDKIEEEEGTQMVEKEGVPLLPIKPTLSGINCSPTTENNEEGISLLPTEPAPAGKIMTFL